MKRTAITFILVITVAVFSAFATGQGETETLAESENPGTTSALAPYDPSITMRWARSTDDTVEAALDAVDETLQDNRWNELIERDMGIQIEYDWIAPSASEQYNNRVNISIASGDLPGFMEVNASQLRQLMDGDLLHALDGVYPRYATSTAVELLEAAGEAPFVAGMRDGELFALPHIGDAYTDAGIMHIRVDWLEQLGLDAPTTISELETVMEAFVNQDPDGNGEDDTYGIAVSQNYLTDPVAQLRTIFNAQGAYPRTWIETSDGDLSYGSIARSTRDSLERTAEWYASGLIDPEFVVKDFEKESELIVAGKIGVNYGAFWNMIFPLQAAYQNNGAQWRPFPTVGSDEGDLPRIAVNSPARTWWVATTATESPEALVKLLSYVVDIEYNQVDERDPVGGLTFRQYYWGDNDLIGTDSLWKLRPLYLGDPLKNLKDHWEVAQALENPDHQFELSRTRRVYRDVASWMTDQDPNARARYFVFGPDQSAYSVIDRYYNNNQLFYDSFVGAPTDTMATRWETLVQLEEEVFTRIIVGESDISAFDEFVEDWLELGGRQITDEVNAWFDRL